MRKAILYGNGFIISYQDKKPVKYRWEVVDTNWFGKNSLYEQHLKRL